MYLEANNVVLGSNCKIQNNVSLYEGVVCRRGCFIGRRRYLQISLTREAL